LILSSVKAFPKWVVCWISPNKLTWLLAKGHGIAIMAKILPRVRDNAVKYLEEKPEVAAEIEKLLRDKLDMGSVPFPTEPADEDEGDDEEPEI
jgi:recombination protein RecA